MELKDYEEQVCKIRENIRRIKENEIGLTLEEELNDGDVDETTRTLLGLNILKRNTTQLIENLKQRELITVQLKEICALEADFSDVLNNVHETVNVKEERRNSDHERHSYSDETNPFLPQYSALRKTVERDEEREYAQDNHPARKNSQPANIAELRRLTTLVSSNTQKIKTTVEDISRMVQLIGTPEDSHDLKERLSERLQYSRKLVQDTMTILSDVNVTLPEQTTSEQIYHKKQVQRLAKDFDMVAKQFQAIQKESASKQKAVLERMSELHEDKQVATGITGFQQQALLPKDCDDIQEQQEAIQKLESDILVVNEIFQGLHVMVHEQGEKIDTIEANVTNAVEYVEKGRQNLVKAEKSQISRRKKIIICGTVGIIFLITLIIIIVISVS